MNLFESALESLFDLSNDLAYAMEAPIDVTGDTNADTANALGPDARTAGGNNNDLNTENLDSPGDLLKQENADGGGNTEEDDAGDDTGGDEEGDDTAPDEEGGNEEDPTGDGTGDEENPEETPEDTTDDPDSIKKRRLLDNMIEMHSIIQKNVDLLAKCNVTTVSANMGGANAKVINILNDMADIIYRTLTDGSWESTEYTELMRKYVTLNMIFDIVVKMLEENVHEAEKEKERSTRTAKARANRYKIQLKNRAKNVKLSVDRTQKFMGSTPKGHSGV